MKAMTHQNVWETNVLYSVNLLFRVGKKVNSGMQHISKRKIIFYSPPYKAPKF